MPPAANVPLEMNLTCLLTTMPLRQSAITASYWLPVSVVFVTPVVPSRPRSMRSTVVIVPELSSLRIQSIIGVSASTGASSGVGELRMMPTKRSSEVPSSMTQRSLVPSVKCRSVTAVTIVSLSQTSVKNSRHGVVSSALRSGCGAVRISDAICP